MPVQKSLETYGIHHVYIYIYIYTNVSQKICNILVMWGRVPDAVVVKMMNPARLSDA